MISIIFNILWKYLRLSNLSFLSVLSAGYVWELSTIVWVQCRDRWSIVWTILFIFLSFTTYFEGIYSHQIYLPDKAGTAEIISGFRNAKRTIRTATLFYVNRIFILKNVCRLLFHYFIRHLFILLITQLTEYWI